MPARASSLDECPGQHLVSTTAGVGLAGADGGVLRAQVRAVVQGRASAWQKHLILTPTTPGASEAVRRSLLGATRCV